MALKERVGCKAVYAGAAAELWLPLLQGVTLHGVSVSCKNLMPSAPPNSFFWVSPIYKYDAYENEEILILKISINGFMGLLMGFLMMDDLMWLP